MVAISIHPLVPSPSLVTGYNNVGSWAIEGVVRLVAGSHPDHIPDSKAEGKHKASFTATSIKITLNVAVGTFVGTRSESDLLAALGSSGSRDAKWNGIVHLNKDLEIIPQTTHGANGVVIKEGEPVDLPFRFEFGSALPPTCEVERGRYNAFSRYRLRVDVQGRPHGFKNVLDARNVKMEYDVPVPFYDVGQVKKLLNPQPQTWSGSTEELDWSISLGSQIFSPNEFTTVFLKAALHPRNDGGANPTASEPTTQAAAMRTSNKRLAPAPFIRRATFKLFEEASIQTYQVAHTPAAAAVAPHRGGFDLKLRRRSKDSTLIDRDVGGGMVEIFGIDIDGENLEHGHELKIQLPTMSPALPTPGSKMNGKAQIDRKMSTGDTTGIVQSSVQVNPSGTWGTFQVSHMARVTIEVADGHTVLWETPVTVAPCTAAQARSLVVAYPDYLNLAETSNPSSATASTAELEEVSREILVKAAQMVNAVVRPDVPCVRVDSDAAVAAVQ
ncbi:uncharacterized protein SPPG_04461 [Spizellomyces punctatus DAOM BR117]|uniref:Uncharacterized protein n=1 Tax=Spizellomyces punctatus (strain DAOM BR117) TaxID=645134 RepID=A0A0L0HH60_SPIPD|nr:uncharacterized protein SPPG_04461 [Spizellomyces punctatus DAOM BR117]KND00119.1 hypothetical protein SPPG_04461 [Spizellomyces punctatus DAOM BR117]|eukprot:XP_016608158.1 hypothetical protein SPPG_04461 [Spizellomyces punctatus DAOM BR117]